MPEIKENQDKKSYIRKDTKPVINTRSQGKTFDEINQTILTDSTKFNIKEAYKATRTNIMFAVNGDEEGCKTIILTSSIPGEGKSLTAINIAITFGQIGAKVLLIDSDLRKAKLHKYMKSDNKMGLSNILGGFDKLDDCIKTSEEYGIDYITAGHTPPNPIELLSSDKMEKMLNTLKERYDYIFLDTPPVNVVTDTAAIAHMSDGILFVVRHRYTTHDMVYKAINSLEFVNAKILGFLLNDVDMSSYSYTAKTKYGNYKYKNYYSYNSYYY